MQAMREKLREFYQKQFAESLSVRKTASNYLLVEKRDGKKTILARFDIAELGEADAVLLARTACDSLAKHRSDVEMAKLDVQQPPPPGALPTDGEGMEMPLKDFPPPYIQSAPVREESPISDLFNMGRTASSERPLE